ncbi:MAG: PAS domain-containing sensor histidine kinase, partial [Chloroflexota bacterium]
QLGKYLLPPQLDDPEENRKGQLIWTVFITLHGLGMTAYFFAAYTIPEILPLIGFLGGTASGLTLLIFGLIHNGKIKLAGHLLCSTFAVLFFITACWVGGIRGVGFTLHFILIVLSGIILDRQGLWTYTPVIIASTVLIYFLERVGITSPIILDQVQFSDAFMATLVIGGVAGLISIAVGSTSRAYTLLLDSLDRLQKTTVSKEYADNIIDSMHDMLIVVDEDMQIRTVNQTVLNKLGYATDKDLVGKKFEILFPEGSAPYWVYSISKDEAIDRSRANAYHKFLSADKRVIEISLSSSLIEYRPETFGTVCVAHDISKQKQAERALIKANQNAEKMVEAKSDFFANMSHELRTSLNGILGVLTLFEDKPVDDETAEYIELIQESGENLMQIVGDILEFTSASDAKVSSNRSEPILIQVLLQSAVDKAAIKASEKGISLYSTISPNVPESALGNEEDLLRILENLLSNSLKFTHKGTIELRAEVGNACEEAFYLNLSISDTGIGIPNDQLDQIFEPLYQVDSSSTRKYGGTGMGLAVCKQLVEEMKGSISVESEPNEGTTMVVKLLLQHNHEVNPQFDLITSE